jgi:tetraacyldisaccharide 4'-kinase
MRAELERWLNQIWYGGQPAPLWLRTLVPLYRGGFLLDRAIKKSRSSDLAGRPILVIGNLNVGGSGKTPLVIRLCRILQDAGLKVGVASRGYGRNSRGLQRVNVDSDPAIVGDEPLLVAQRTRVPVIVANDRCAAARALFGLGVNVVIADDGLQHHRLPRNMEICVIDSSRGFGNGLQLPAGPLREPQRRLQQVDYVVLNGEFQTDINAPNIVRMSLVPGMLQALDQKLSWRLSQFSGCRASAVAGIANPERFFHTLEQAGLLLDRHAWPDHHAYRPADFAALNPDYPIIMTEKDAVKCRGLNLRNAWYLAVDAHLPGNFELAVAEGMMQAVNQSGRST